MAEKILGLIVNPIAGVGGKAGLKGSDGEAIQKLALERGAQKDSPRRAEIALRALKEALPDTQILTCPGEMGEAECLAAGFVPEILPISFHTPTTPQDTECAVRELIDRGADLLLFAGGDGTARNVCTASEGKIAVIGIPSGVKIHSAVFAKNPRYAGLLAADFLTGKAPSVRDLEVMDIDEDAYRSGRVTARLYGYLPVPFVTGMVQKLKAGSSNEASALHAIASDICERMEDDCYYIIGAGTTTKCITDYLGLEKTLLGVDIIYRKKLVSKDLSEKELLTFLQGRKAKIVITPIGGQGYLFGRGNQQLSRDVICAVGISNIIVIATLQKIADLGGAPFSVDMDKAEEIFPKYMRVVTGYRQELVYPVSI